MQSLYAALDTSEVEILCNTEVKKLLCLNTFVSLGVGRITTTTMIRISRLQF